MDPLLLQGLAMPMLAQVKGLVGSGQRPVMALNGPVGAGKSLFCQQLMGLAKARGLRLAVASIDDAYLPWEQRLVAMAGNPFGVNRVPPGSHDAPLLVERLHRWRSGGALQLPRFDKTLRDGAGDRVVEAPGSESATTIDALVLEGWLMGCRPLGAAGLRAAGVAPGMELAAGLAPLGLEEAAWLPHWDRQLGPMARSLISAMGSGCCDPCIGLYRSDGASKPKPGNGACNDNATKPTAGLSPPSSIGWCAQVWRRCRPASIKSH